MRIIIIVGARPNFIKVGPLMPALASAGVDARIAHTGQHYDAAMSDVFFSDLEIPEPAWFLGVGSGTHAVQTGTAMMKLEELLAVERPDALLGGVMPLVTDQLSSMLLTPVREADDNLVAEGVDPARIHFVGNIMAESVLRNLERITNRDVCGEHGLACGGYRRGGRRPRAVERPRRLPRHARAAA